MPTYEYECLECKEKFEVFQSIKDQPVQECVKCKGKVRKLISKAAVIYKGSGFYVTDYKKEDKSAKASSPCASCAANGSTCAGGGSEE